MHEWITRTGLAAAIVFAVALAAVPAAAGSDAAGNRVAMGSGMMDGQGMGPGMMRPGQENGDWTGNDGEGAGDPAGRLVTYIQSNGLTCLACHAISGRRAGPDFTGIGQRYAGASGAEATLTQSIANGVAGKWPGYPPMPGGQASSRQAADLANLILQLGR